MKHEQPTPAELERLLVLSPFGVNPARSGGHAAVLEPARQFARSGIDVHLFGWGVRRFEAFEHRRSFVRVIEARLVEERHVSLVNWLDYLRRGRSGLPPIDAGRQLWRRASVLLRVRMAAAQVIVCECPWLWSFVPPDRPRVLVAQNVEAALVEQNKRARPRDVARAAAVERTAWREADAVICLTEEDRNGLVERYGERDADVIPLGVDADKIRPASGVERQAAKAALGVDGRFVVLFSGAWHKPNVEAMERMIAWGERLASGTAGARPLFVVAGSIGDREKRGADWLVTGPLEDLSPWFRAADCCVNPVTTGSGANVKVLEYLASGVPVVSTPFGARGLAVDNGEHLMICSPAEFPDAIARLAADADRAQSIGTAGRNWVVEHRTWSTIAAERRVVLDRVLDHSLRGVGREPAAPSAKRYRSSRNTTGSEISPK